MNAASGIPARVFKDGLYRAGERVCAARDELCALDAAAGDGDLGATLATGFEHVRAALDELDEADVGAMLTRVGVELGRKAPSTIGTLMATAFLRAGKRLAGVSYLQTHDVAAMLDAACSGVAERGGAAVGERTILDAMSATAAEAAKASASGADPENALAAAAIGAEAGAAATSQMEPRHGRAGWIPDRARGTKDAGAVAWAVYLTGLAEGCRASNAAT
jgi:dihydroxyacetone kinase-like protein